MARTVLIYDGIEYEIREADVRAVMDAVVEVATNAPSWLAIGAEGGVVVQLFISQGVNIAIRVEQFEGGRDVDVDTEESVQVP